jgi:hypothetical protein
MSVANVRLAALRQRPLDDADFPMTDCEAIGLIKI